MSASTSIEKEACPLWQKCPKYNGWPKFATVPLSQRPTDRLTDRPNNQPINQRINQLFNHGTTLDGDGTTSRRQPPPKNPTASKHSRSFNKKVTAHNGTLGPFQKNATVACQLNPQPHQVCLGAFVHPEEHEAADAYPGHLAERKRQKRARGRALQAFIHLDNIHQKPPILLCVLPLFCERSHARQIDRIDHDLDHLE